MGLVNLLISLHFDRTSNVAFINEEEEDNEDKEVTTRSGGCEDAEKRRGGGHRRQIPGMRVFGCRSEQNISQANFVHLLFYFKLNTLQLLASCWARIISQAAAIPGACVCVEVGRGVLGWGGGACCLSTHKHAKDNAQREREGKSKKVR